MANKSADTQARAATLRQDPARIQRILDGIPGKTEPELKQLEANCARDPTATGIEQILKTIVVERETRLRNAAQAKVEASHALTGRLDGLDLTSRIVLACTERPLNDSEIRFVRALHAQAEQDEEELAKRAQHHGPGGFRTVVGKLCRDRASYFPTREKSAADGKIHWESLICDLSIGVRGGKPRPMWSLKPEAVAAFRRMHVLAAAPS